MQTTRLLSENNANIVTVYLKLKALCKTIFCKKAKQKIETPKKTG